MDFNFTEEQTLLRNSVQRYLADNYKFEDWRKFTRSEAGRDPKHWAQFAELGLLAAPIPEEHGGLGGDALSSLIIMEEFGGALVIEPYVPTVVIGGGFLKYGGSDALKGEWLPNIAGGETIMAFAFAESGGRFNLADLTTTAKKQGSEFRTQRPEIGRHRCAVGGSTDRDRAHLRWAARCERRQRFPRRQEDQGRLDARLSHRRQHCARRRSPSRMSKCQRIAPDRRTGQWHCR